MSRIYTATETRWYNEARARWLQSNDPNISIVSIDKVYNFLDSMKSKVVGYIHDQSSKMLHYVGEDGAYRVSPIQKYVCNDLRHLFDVGLGNIYLQDFKPYRIVSPQTYEILAGLVLRFAKIEDINTSI